jgi:transcriptional regulator with XRE-family HTH domain
MVRNTEKYEQAISLRKRGFTLAEIAKYCDISKSTASEWLKNKVFSAEITKQNVKRAGAENAKRLKLINKARNSERATKYSEVLKSAEVEFKHYQDNPLFVAGIMLYIGEGDNRHRRLIRISSARLEVHRVFIKFASEFLGVERKKIRFWILLYPELSEEICMKKWQKATSLPYSQFYKNQVIQGKSNKRTLQYGVGNTIIGSTALKYKLNRWIELTMKKLVK